MKWKKNHTNELELSPNSSPFLKSFMTIPFTNDFNRCISYLKIVQNRAKAAKAIRSGQNNLILQIYVHFLASLVTFPVKTMRTYEETFCT